MNRLCSMAAMTFLLTGVISSRADQVWDNPDKAAQEDACFNVQGEYAGKRGNAKIGLQVMALGKHEFEAYLLEGGLPGDGWDKSKKRTQYNGRISSSATVLEAKDGSKITIIAGAATLTDAEGKLAGQLQYGHRKSATIGAKPPSGAVVLFDGKSVDQWRDGAKMTDDGLLMQGCFAKPAFGDHTLHVEFRLPYMPDARGQGRGNSGVYLQGRFEVQVLDSFGLEGKNNECGGIYSVRDPDVNMCFPPLTWQTYDIDFTAARFDETGKKTANARMTVRHNGVAVHNDVEVPHTTTAAPAPEGKDPTPEYLQDHGTPVRYRNIWVVEKK